MSEQSLAADPSETSPFGSPTPRGGGTAAADPVAEALPSISIVDNILNLDAFLSADIRRAERTARFCTRPDLEAKLDELNAELELLTDSAGNPLPLAESSLGEGARTAQQVAVEIHRLLAEYGAAFVSIRMLQMPADDWDEWLKRHKEVLDNGGPYPAEFWDDLIVDSAHQPKINHDQVKALRARLGKPQMVELGNTAWTVNAESGVSIPKSPLSSHVLRRAVRAQS